MHSKRASTGRTVSNLSRNSAETLVSMRIYTRGTWTLLVHLFGYVIKQYRRKFVKCPSAIFSIDHQTVHWLPVVLPPSPGTVLEIGPLKCPQFSDWPARSHNRATTLHYKPVVYTDRYTLLFASLPSGNRTVLRPGDIPGGRRDKVTENVTVSIFTTGIFGYFFFRYVLVKKCLHNNCY